MSDEPTHVAVPVPLAQSILDYLATRPYGEVYRLISALQSLEPAPAGLDDKVAE